MLVLLDRDGVLNMDRPDSVRTVDELVVLPRAKQALALLTERGCTNVIITNQSVVGRGIISEAELRQIHDKLCHELQSAGGKIHDIIYCTDAPERATYRRKPKPGMLVEALEKYTAAPADTPFIGDALTDLEAALAAGCPRYLVRTGKGVAALQVAGIEAVKPFTVCEDVYDAAVKILERRKA